METRFSNRRDWFARPLTIWYRNWPLIASVLLAMETCRSQPSGKGPRGVGHTRFVLLAASESTIAAGRGGADLARIVMLYEGCPVPETSAKS